MVRQTALTTLLSGKYETHTYICICLLVSEIIVNYTLFIVNLTKYCNSQRYEKHNSS